MGHGEKLRGLILLSRNEIHKKIVKMLSDQWKGRLLDVPTWTRVLRVACKRWGLASLVAISNPLSSLPMI